MIPILQNYEIRVIAAAAGSAGTAVDGTGIDCSECDSIAFMTRIATANAGNYIKVMGSDSLASGYVDIAGTRATAVANNDCVITEVIKPITYRYYRATIIRAGANTATEILVAIAHRSAKPPTNTTSTQIVTTTVSPAAGTP